MNKKVAIIGNGNWGTTIAKVIANNILGTSDFDPEVLLWVFEETYQQQKLSEYINEIRINPIYLPGIKIPENIRAVTTFDEINTADILVFCLPTRFLSIIREIKPKKGAFGVNLCKGFILRDERLKVPSEYIRDALGIECCSLMGANIAVEVASDQLAECTVGYTKNDQVSWLEWMFDSHTMRPRMVQYDRGMEICGGLKNIISLGFGIVDGMEWGLNTKAMLFRKGLVEIERLCQMTKSKMFLLESCCVGDLLASCLGGRNYRCGVEMAKKRCLSKVIEEKLGGQKLEGPEASKMLVEWCECNKIEVSQFPIIQAVHRICFLGEAPEYLYSVLKKTKE